MQNLQASTANKYQLVMTSTFKRDFKRIQRQHKNTEVLRLVVNALLKGETLEAKYKDHVLSGNWNGFRECHLAPDWLLIYLKNDEKLVLTLTRTGSHSDLLKK